MEQNKINSKGQHLWLFKLTSKMTCSSEKNQKVDKSLSLLGTHALLLVIYTGLVYGLSQEIKHPLKCQSQQKSPALLPAAMF